MEFDPSAIVDFLLMRLQLFFTRALLIGLGCFTLVHYLRHRSLSNLSFALGGLLAASGTILQTVVVNFFAKTMETDTAEVTAIYFPTVPWRLAIALAVAGCGTLVVTGILRTFGRPRPVCEKNED